MVVSKKRYQLYSAGNGAGGSGFTQPAERCEFDDFLGPQPKTEPRRNAACKA